MATPMLSPVLAPPGAPQRMGGLLAASLPGDTNARWTSGVMTWFESAPGWRLVTDCSPEVSDHGAPDDLRPTAGVPVLVQTSTRCPRPEIDQMTDRARARLDAVTGRALARELWSGDLTAAAPFTLPGPWEWTNPNPTAGDYTNPHLTAPPAEELEGAGDVLEAVSRVEQAVAARMVGGVPHVHVPLEALAGLLDYLDPRGDVLYTLAGSVVVADHGYPPAGETGVVYGTGPVTVWTGPIDVLDDPAQVVSVGTNEIEVWAERPALALFDPATLVSCQVTTV